MIPESKRKKPAQIFASKDSQWNPIFPAGKKGIVRTFALSS
jgi:hypothetical protein